MEGLYRYRWLLNTVSGFLENTSVTECLTLNLFRKYVQSGLQRLTNPCPTLLAAYKILIRWKIFLLHLKLGPDLLTKTVSAIPNIVF